MDALAHLSASPHPQGGGKDIRNEIVDVNHPCARLWTTRKTYRNRNRNKKGRTKGDTMPENRNENEEHTGCGQTGELTTDSTAAVAA